MCLFHAWMVWDSPLTQAEVKLISDLRLGAPFLNPLRLYATVQSSGAMVAFLLLRFDGLHHGGLRRHVGLHGSGDRLRVLHHALGGHRQ